MLPLDYADKGVDRQRRNVGRLTMVTTLVIISIGASRIADGALSQSWTSQSVVDVLVIFLMALVISDLASEGDRNQTRVASISSISWPILIAFSVTPGDRSDEIASSLIFLLVAILLQEHSRRAYSHSVLGRRYRGILGGFGVSTSVAIMISKASSNEVIAFSTSIMVLILAYDVLRKDPSNHGRSALMRAIDEIESEILEINERGIILDQASSLLKLAREEGWKNTLNGSKRLDSVRREIDSALALDEDLIELRSVVKPLVDRATGIAPEVDEPANLLSEGDNERSLGSFRKAEAHYRSAQISATRICDYWESATKALHEAESIEGGHESTQSQTIKGLIQIAREAMEDHRPDEALRILKTLPEQIQSLDEAIERVRSKRGEIERELESEHDDLLPNFKEKLDSIDDMILRGELSVAMGALDSIDRTLSGRRESKRSFNQSIRQRSTIEKRIPDYHKDRILSKIEESMEMSRSGSWIEADSTLKEVLDELDSLQDIERDTKELLLFIEDEWKKTRKRLEANSIGPMHPTRKMVEKNVTEARLNFNKGAYHLSRSNMGKADEGIEALRRLV